MAHAIIETYGCTLNQSDSDMIEGALHAEGIDTERGRYKEDGESDYVIVNTCTVKTPTERRIIDRLRKLSHLGNKLIITGCMASANRDKITEVAPRASIISTSNIHMIRDALAEISAGNGVSYTRYSRIDKLGSARMFGGVVARIPISEGCLSSCNFCETKFARGPLNSFDERLILKAMEIAVEKGAKEIELTSQDVGAYGIDRGTNIGELVSMIADMEGDFRVRIGMLNPEHLNKYIDTLFSAYSDRRIYRFIHLPVQSGSDRVLHDMDRRYDISCILDHIHFLRKKIPGISIETDMIVGYPTESHEDFEDSIDFIEHERPAFTNVSRFGARPHTKASGLPRISDRIIKERSSEMSRVARAVQHQDMSKLIGTTESILITESNKRSFVGRDDYYRPVAISKGYLSLKEGERIDAKIVGNTSVCLLGEFTG